MKKLLPLILAATSLALFAEKTPEEILKKNLANQRLKFLNSEKQRSEERAQLIETSTELKRRLEQTLAALEKTKSNLKTQNVAREQQKSKLQKMQSLVQDTRRMYRDLPIRYNANLSTAQSRILPSDPSINKLAEHTKTFLSAHSFKGEAADENGFIHNGTLVIAGPAQYFTSEDQSLAGLIHDGNGLTPQVFTHLTTEETESIKQLCSGQSAAVPVDTSNGEILKLKAASPEFLEQMKKGGITMIPLFIMGAFCLAVTVFKTLSLLKTVRSSKEKDIHRILSLVRENNIEEALKNAEHLPSPLGLVIVEGIRNKDSKKEHLEEIMYEKLLAQTPALERYLSPLAVCAGAAPLLGLFGTVTGMIHTFQLITVFGTGNAGSLSAGISEALITTEAGLAIAVPTLLIHAYLSRSVRKAVAVTQQNSIAFVNNLKLLKVIQ